jgi:selenide,water dikinase
VFLNEGTALVATADLITPVCDDPRRFGRVAAANSCSDIYAMGGRPLFALNLCCFPESVPHEALAEILQGGADVLQEAGAALLGGHTLQDDDLKYGMAVVGQADPARLLTNAGARPDDRLLLTKPLGTGVLIGAFRRDLLDAAGLEPALVEMERLNATAARLALEHEAHAGTDVTGFGLAGHALNLARASGVGVEIELGRLPVHERFHELAARGVCTAATAANRRDVEPVFENRAGLADGSLEVLFDPQTSGGLLLAVAPRRAPALLDALRATGHRAADIGRIVAGRSHLAVV